MFTPLISGVDCPKPLVLQCFFDPTPLIKGVKCHPVNQGGGVWVVRALEMGPKVGTKFRARSTRDRNLQCRGAVSTGFFEFSPVDFFPLSPGFMCNSFFSRSYVQFRKEIAPKCGEWPISGRRKMRKILSRLWLSWFFRSRCSGFWGAKVSQNESKHTCCPL